MTNGEIPMGTGTLGAFCYLENENGEVLCVRQNYSEKLWTLPGGRVEHGEDPREAAVRELLEETGIVAVVDTYIGTYSAPYRDDIVILFKMNAEKFDLQTPNQEISELGFYSKTALPEPMSGNTKMRLQDAIDGKRGVFRVFSEPSVEAK